MGMPPGDAPENIRRAWIGEILPVAGRERGMHAWGGHGVLFGPRTILGDLARRLRGRPVHDGGFVVDARVAIQLLAERSPDAARWWIENTPRLFRPGYVLWFAPEACQELAM
ncbi:MAG: hypothetical protein HYX51_05975 [Chloroflexi bacterium]|nr:hypothetical protein [Chloroflexota bacterium]